jgi:uncharacterized protein DUF4332/phosphoinositide 3-/4-kinase-like protein
MKILNGSGFRQIRTLRAPSVGKTESAPQDSWTPSVVTGLRDIGQIRKEMKAQLKPHKEAERLKDFSGNQGEAKRKQEDYTNAAFQLALDDNTSEQAKTAIFSVLEAALSDPEVTIKKSKNLGGGINKTEFVTLSNGLSAVWKPDEGASGAKIHRNIPLGGEADRDVSAYVVDKRLGHLAGVPPTIKREFEGKSGILTLFLGGAETAGRATDARNAVIFGQGRDTSKPLAILDNVIGNLDRHGGNWMLTPTGEPVPIDHGLSFPNRNGNQIRANYQFYRDAPLSEDQGQRLEDFLQSRSEISKELEPKIGKRALGAMWRRVETILKNGKADDSWLGETRVWRQSATGMEFLKNQNYDLSEIPGLSKEAIAALKEAGVKDSMQLVNSLGHRHQRRGVEEGRGELAGLNNVFTPEKLLKMINTVDLMRLSGIGPSYAQLLQEAGVSSLPDLARRSPQNLAERLREIGEDRKRLPNVELLSEWVDKAELMTPRVTH